ncbi:caffeoyl-CoA O-methyltransferase 2-like [Salvia miltiorrhiza]|uniref:caffeoyl-CoA O-methyltransferase 2-like n=1 Tax=Salvia miltiorrhiza TaxID=226208 RepID=UPI0025AC0621|nr:caffeoyl-CoA O-methyltransferase 2-like [Salvia miltiorrhiza]XP_057812437.1 caffeoyl-CoA O-methyltransferase 2-like [Salvia miltiorrhiza]
METKAVINTSSTEKGVLQTAELYKYIMDTSVYPREQECLKELRAITSTHPRTRLIILQPEFMVCGGLNESYVELKRLVNSQEKLYHMAS